MGMTRVLILGCQGYLQLDYDSTRKLSILYSALQVGESSVMEPVISSLDLQVDPNKHQPYIIYQLGPIEQTPSY